MSCRSVLLFSLTLALVPLLHAAAPEFWRLEGADALMKGDLERLSVDSEARLRLGPAVRAVYDPETPTAWCLARDSLGTLYVGTGNDGRLFRVRANEGEAFFDAEELEIHAVAVASDGTVYAATSPDGAVYAIDESGESSVFFDPPETYVWALAVEASGSLLVATGGEGRVYRVLADGTSTTLLTSSDAHVLSLAVDGDGRVFAGSSPEGIVYRIGTDGDVFVLLDSPYSEIKALAVAEDGVLFAGAVNGGTPAPAPSAPSPPAQPSGSPPTAQVTVIETLAAVQPAAPGTTAPSSSTASGSGPARGALLRLDPDGSVETLWRSPDDAPHSLAFVEGGVLLGTGDSGNVYRVARDGSWVFLASLPGKQVTGLSPGPGRATAVVTANPARVHELSGAMASRGTLVSEVQDATTAAVWGRLQWEGRAPQGTRVRVETRSGNTSKPDSTWGDWVEVQGEERGGAIRSESARFLQLRLSLEGSAAATPQIEALSAAFLQHNLRPQVTSITVHPPGEVFQKPIAVSGEMEVLGLDPDPLAESPGDQGLSPQSPLTAFSRKFLRKGLRTLVWLASDPNGDTLVYDVSYRALGDARWRVLRSGLREAVVAWDTTAMPDGRYVVRVTASDAPDNPPDRALSGEKDSTSFQVDNAPPSLTASLAGGASGRVRVVARDSGSRIGSFEFSVDAGRWQEVYPVDGINDSTEEIYEFGVDRGEGSRPRVVVLRVTDGLGNVATGRIDVP